VPNAVRGEIHEHTKERIYPMGRLGSKRSMARFTSIRKRLFNINTRENGQTEKRIYCKMTNANIPKSVIVTILLVTLLLAGCSSARHEGYSGCERACESLDGIYITLENWAADCLCQIDGKIVNIYQATEETDVA